MIIFHKRKFIYIRLKKVGSSSFESAFMTKNGISLEEKIPEELYQNLRKKHKNAVSKSLINTHTTARELQSLLPEEMWNSYLKVATIRCPYDMLVSHYYYALSRRKISKSFEQFMSEGNKGPLVKICDLHNEEGQILVDYLIRYEHLEEDIGELEEKIGCPGLLKKFQDTRKKEGTRPKTGTSSCEMYSNYPEVKQIVDEECRKWADKGYDFFETYWPAYKAKLEQEISEYKDSSQSQKESIIG